MISAEYELVISRNLSELVLRADDSSSMIYQQ